MILTASLKRACSRAGLKVEFRDIGTAMKTQQEIARYKEPFTKPTVPSFGWANREGKILDIMDTAKMEALAKDLRQARRGKAADRTALIVFGSGSAIPELSKLYDLQFYFDTTKESVQWTMWDALLTPFGATQAKKDYFWKDYYYCDFYLLNEQKHFGFKHMDYWVQAVEAKHLNFVPRKAFDGILSTLVRYPTKNVVTEEIKSGS